MRTPRRLSPLVLLLVGLGGAALGGCRSAPPAVMHEREPVGLAEEPAGTTAQAVGRSPQPVGPKPGQGCRQVTLAPPCTLSHFGPAPNARPEALRISYFVRYKDAEGREVTPYFLAAKREEQPALEQFFKEEKHRVVQCQGGWTTAPCNDTPHFTGFPEPPVGTVTRR